MILSYVSLGLLGLIIIIVANLLIGCDEGGG